MNGRSGLRALAIGLAAMVLLIGALMAQQRAALCDDALARRRTMEQPPGYSFLTSALGRRRYQVAEDDVHTYCWPLSR